jgi:Uma2 family endonuclease
MDLPLPEPDAWFSREEYRRWCEAQPRGRFERVDGRVMAMSAERAGHARMKFKVLKALERAVATAGIACEAMPNGMTVEVGDNDYEPDALVNCGPPMADEDIAAPNPVIVVEVLSPGTRSIDTAAKLADYFLVPSIAHYLIVHPARRRIIHHRRSDDGIATRIIASGPIAMDPPGIVITADEIYGAE